jgi:hypothetical protein
MANVFTAQGLEQLSSAFVAMLADGGVLVNTIWRDTPSAAFTVGRGDTVTIREPLLIPAANLPAGGTTTVSDVVEAKYTVVINQNPYSQTTITGREKTLYIESLVQEVIQPQAAGITEYIDAAIAAHLATTTGTAVGPAGGSWVGAISGAREKLSVNKVPASGRTLACAPDVVTAILSETVVTVGNLNNAGTALAEGTVGRLHGFNIVESPMLTAGQAFAYHESAIAGVFRLPVAPEGGAVVGSASYNGFSAQTIFAYDSSRLADILTVQALFGLGNSSATYDERCLLVSTTP